jgi:hypothetical protein
VTTIATINRNRRVQRLRLDPPLDARLGTLPAKLVDLSIYGAGIEHLVPLNAGAPVQLRIEGMPIAIEGNITRCSMRLERGSTIYRCGISFKHTKEHVPAALKELMTRELYKAIAQWKANARGVLPDALDRMPIFNANDRLVAQSSDAHKAPTSFIWYRLVHGTWETSVTLDPNQPIDGFAVSADDDQTQMALLRETYEKSDEAGRQLIRLLAHLSIASATNA